MNDGNRTDSTVPSCGRLQFSLGCCGVAVNLNTSVLTFQRQRPSPLVRARPQTRQPFANRSSAIFMSCHPPSVCQRRNLRRDGIDSVPRVCARPHGRSPLPIKGPEDLSWLVHTAFEVPIDRTRGPIILNVSDSCQIYCEPPRRTLSLVRSEWKLQMFNRVAHRVASLKKS
jgi:hypothetical protein